MSDNSEVLILMGVCGVGKTSVAKQLAETLPAIYVEADDYHPPENIEAMKRGDALTDGMREPWLRGICQEILSLQAKNTNRHIVVACSALKRSYRELIRSYLPDAKVIFLTGPSKLIRERMAARQDHFMPTTLLDSQLATLEPPGVDESHLEISIVGTRDDVVSDIVSHLTDESKPQ